MLMVLLLKRMWLLGGQAGDTKGIAKDGVIGGIGGSGTGLVLLLLLRYDGGGPRLSRRIGGLPCPAGCTGG